MLRIAFEIAPNGDPDIAYGIAEIEVANVSGPGRSSNDYAWRILRDGTAIEHGYLLDRGERDAVDLLHAVLRQRAIGGLPCDNHGRRRPPDGLPDDPAKAWRPAPRSPMADPATLLQEIAGARLLRPSPGGDRPHDEHIDGELARAAAACALVHVGHACLARDLWPWQEDNSQPGGRRAALIEATMLLLDEIARIDRAARPPPHTDAE